MSDELAPLALYAPLWGASLHNEGIIILSREWQLCLYRPDREEWSFIEKSDIWVERLRNGIPPPPCLVAFRDREAGESIYELATRERAAMRAIIGEGVAALRLAAPGWFLDPAMAALTFSLPTEGWYERFPGPYRQAMLGTLIEPLPGYNLENGDDENWTAPNLIELMTAAALGENSALSIALAAFNRSYGYVLPMRDRAAELFTAIDAILVGMSAQRVGRVRLRRFGFRRRAEQALLFAGVAADTAAHYAAWVDSPDHGRGLRNALAHGRLAEARPGADDILKLQAIVRGLLRSLLLFEVGRLDDVDFPVQLGLNSDAAPTLLFNRWLERRESPLQAEA